MYRKERVVEKELELTSANIERHGVDVIYGTGSFIDSHTIHVEMESGACLDLTAEVVLIATGSCPFRPSNIPFDDDTVYDSDTILQIDNIPKSMTVLGAGVIGCEYACIFAALGVDVVLVDARDRILPFVDGEITERLVQRMRKLGVQLMLEEESSSVERFSSPDDGDCVRTRLKSGQVVETENLLFASGRSGNTAALGLEKVGVTANKRGQVSVNESFQTSIPHIYAAGDVIGFPALASTSMEQGRLAMCHAFGLDYKKRMASLLPYGIYTIPEISMVGETEETLREKGVDYEVGRASYENNSRGQIVGDTQGLFKLLFAPDTLKLLGVHIIGENATEIIHAGMLAMYYGGTIDCFIQCVFNYPTLSEGYKYAAYDGLGRLARRRAAAAPPVAAAAPSPEPPVEKATPAPGDPPAPDAPVQQAASSAV